MRALTQYTWPILLARKGERVDRTTSNWRALAWALLMGVTIIAGFRLGWWAMHTAQAAVPDVQAVGAEVERVAVGG